jgi:segregation and condensation protein B
MDQAQARRVIEALLFVAGAPVPMKRILTVLLDLEAAAARALLAALAQEYRESRRAFQLQEVAGGYQLVTDRELAPWLQRALAPPKPDAVSAASMETLAIVAYRQPITKAEIEAVRGVDVTASLDGLLEKQFIRITGRKESPGRPFLYGTTPEFLRHFGLRSLEALPAMAQPTIREPEEPSVGADAALAVRAPDVA